MRGEDYVFIFIISFKRLSIYFSHRFTESCIISINNRDIVYNKDMKLAFGTKAGSRVLRTTLWNKHSREEILDTFCVPVPVNAPHQQEPCSVVKGTA